MFPEKKIDDLFSTSQFYLTDGFSSLYRLDRYANESGVLAYFKKKHHN